MNLMAGGSGPVAACDARTCEELGGCRARGGGSVRREECLLTGTDPEAFGSSRAEYPPPDIIFAGYGSSGSGAGEVSRGGKGMGCGLPGHAGRQAGRVNDEGWDGLCGILPRLQLSLDCTDRTHKPDGWHAPRVGAVKCELCLRLSA